MEIELKSITVRDLVAGYQDETLRGGPIVGLGGRLDIRPEYQRNFIYNLAQCQAVVHTMRRGFPLNSIYYATRDTPDHKGADLEVMDGQQRSIAICQYVVGDYAVYIERGGVPMAQEFHNLPAAEQQAILDYQLSVYFCTGTPAEKLEWFQIINIAGMKLTPQELRNAVYHGLWVTAAKRYFSAQYCPAQKLGGNYLRGAANRQEYLETAIEWAADAAMREALAALPKTATANDETAAKAKAEITSYMAAHQQQANADELWNYFQAVIRWVQQVFPAKRSLMKGLPWGIWYNQFHRREYDAAKLEARIVELLQDDEVTKPGGVYGYLLTGEEKYLNLRAFNLRQKQMAFERQRGICPRCKRKFAFDQMDGDHILPWAHGGKTTDENCQMLCRKCNRGG